MKIQDSRHKTQDSLYPTFSFLCFKPWILSLLMLLLLFAGCGEDEAKIMVGVRISGISPPDFALIEQAIDENADKYGAHIVHEKESLTNML